jgi:hypothetical protein
MKALPRLLLLPATFTFLLVAAAEPKPAGEDKLVVEQFDVARDGDLLLLPVTLKGKKYLFLVDTGTTLNLYDASLPLGKPKAEDTADGGDGPVTVPLFDPPDARVGCLSLRSPEPVCGLNLRQLREASGQDIYGILGMSFLHRHVVRIDFDAGKLAFLTGAGPDPGVAVPLTLSRIGAPLVSAEVAGWGREKFTVDTGWSGEGSGSLRRDLFRSLLQKEDLKVVGREGSLSTTGPGRWCRLGQPKGVAVGPFQVPGPVLGEGDTSRLGLGYLLRYTVTFDFPKKVMYMKKGKRFGGPERCNKTGLHLTRSGGEAVVLAVDEGTPAEASGLLKGDVVLSLVGKAADRLTLWELSSLLYTSGKEVRIQVQRGDKQIEATLHLAEEKPAAGPRRPSTSPRRR